MEKGTPLAERVAREIAASRQTSATPPGPTEPAAGVTPTTDARAPHIAPSGSTVTAKTDPALVEAINQVFALFRINYHNQYYAAFSDAEQLRQVKKLWLSSLREYPPAQILQGARRVIDDSEYLPTLHRMRSGCEESLPDLGLPAARAAYLEASNAGDPPEARHWSHPLVYWAGRDCGLQRLATLAEREAWPLFREHYQRRCSAFIESQHCDPVPAAPAARLETKPLDREDALARVQELRAEHEL